MNFQLSEAKNLILFLLLTTTVQLASAQDASHEANKTELVEKIFSEQTYLYSQLVDKCFTFKLSPTC